MFLTLDFTCELLYGTWLWIVAQKIHSVIFVEVSKYKPVDALGAVHNDVDFRIWWTHCHSWKVNAGFICSAEKLINNWVPKLKPKNSKNSSFPFLEVNLSVNKKVILCDRKKHTARALTCPGFGEGIPLSCPLTLPLPPGQDQGQD